MGVVIGINNDFYLAKDCQLGSKIMDYLVTTTTSLQNWGMLTTLIAVWFEGSPFVHMSKSRRFATSIEINNALDPHIRFKAVRLRSNGAQLYSNIKNINSVASKL